MFPDFSHRLAPALRCALLLCMASAAQAPAVEDETLPNVILVMADDQGWGDVGFHGHPHLRTPEMDRMAREGLRFERFYAAASVCSPTRASVMTGRHPNRLGCFSWGHSLRPQEQTLAEILRGAGYRTGHFGKWHLGSVQSGSPVSPGASGFDEWVSAPNFYDNDPILSRNGRAIQTRGESSMVTVDHAIDFMKSCVVNESRFFAVVWFGSPHLPHRALPEDRSNYSELPDEQQHFFGEITAMDRALGKLRRALDAMDISRNSLVWYCSDNGALPKHGSSGGFRGHKGQVFEGGLLVPSMIVWPSVITNPRVVHGRANTSDIFPTLAEIAGVSDLIRNPLDGVSLAGVVNGEDFQQRPGPMGFWNFPERGIRTPSHEWMSDLLEAQSSGYEPMDPSRIRPDAASLTRQWPVDYARGHSAFISDNWKIHRIQNGSEDTVEWQLFDLSSDPGETTNLIGSKATDPELISRLSIGLAQWQSSVIRSLNGMDYSDAAETRRN